MRRFAERHPLEARAALFVVAAVAQVAALLGVEAGAPVAVLALLAVTVVYDWTTVDKRAARDGRAWLVAGLRLIAEGKHDPVAVAKETMRITGTGEPR